MPRLRFPCTIKEGKLSITTREDFDTAIKDLEGDYYLELKSTK